MTEVKDREKKTRRFKAEIKKLLDLIVHSLYSNKEIFLRELISNASDAAEKLRFEALSDETLYEGDSKLKVLVEYDRKARTISVTDNGIGMSREEVETNLGTIAHSGTRRFLEALQQGKEPDSKLIGQFGVGFYSAFVVARTVEVLTRRAGTARTEGVLWRSGGEGGYEVETVDRPKRGTRITLYLREEEDEFLDGARLRAMIRRYSDHVPVPIVMYREEGSGEETVNQATAIWLRNKKDVSDREYKEFYRHVAHDLGDPLRYVHSRVEGKMEYSCLLYVPKQAPLFMEKLLDRHRGVRLYVRRVFIMDDAEQLLPSWLRFVRGVVDSDDLPLNVSREMLQRNRTVEAIRKGCTRKVLDLLTGMAKDEPDAYRSFWREFGRHLKEGMVGEETVFQEDLAELLRFFSTREENAEPAVSLRDYVERMPSTQEAIYYLSADSVRAARGSPHLEIFRERGLEVLLSSDPVDEIVFGRMQTYKDKPFRLVSKEDLDVSATKESGSDKKVEEDVSPGKFDAVLEQLASHLGEKVREVRLSRRLRDSAACLVYGEQDISSHMQRVLRATGYSVPKARPILELNPDHVLVQGLLSIQDSERLHDWSLIFYGQALLSEGVPLAEPADFVRRLNRLLAE